jgi:hypothetical protein
VSLLEVTCEWRVTRLNRTNLGVEVEGSKMKLPERVHSFNSPFPCLPLEREKYTHTYKREGKDWAYFFEGAWLCVCRCAKGIAKGDGEEILCPSKFKPHHTRSIGTDVCQGQGQAPHTKKEDGPLAKHANNQSPCSLHKRHHHSQHHTSLTHTHTHTKQNNHNFVK